MDTLSIVFIILFIVVITIVAIVIAVKYTKQRKYSFNPRIKVTSSTPIIKFTPEQLYEKPIYEKIGEVKELSIYEELIKHPEENVSSYNDALDWWNGLPNENIEKLMMSFICINKWINGFENCTEDLQHYIDIWDEDIDMKIKKQFMNELFINKKTVEDTKYNLIPLFYNTREAIKWWENQDIEKQKDILLTFKTVNTDKNVSRSNIMEVWKASTSAFIKAAVITCAWEKATNHTDKKCFIV
jgi:hypothetical protein